MITDELLARFLVNVVSEPIELSVRELSLVDITFFAGGSTSIREETLTLLDAFNPLTAINVAVLVLINALSVSLAFLDIARVHTTAGVVELALAFHDTVLEFTFVVVIFLFRVVVGSLELSVIRPSTSELVTVLVRQSSFTALLVFQQITCMISC